ncbi:hypothetical protein JQN44_27165, partial [Klebsiella pneumoniae]|uniref:hypothetical protein n=1 Tax=Klebsiella pneumoniae TaxID=573 RepID=UPI00193A18C9
EQVELDSGKVGDKIPVAFSDYYYFVALADHLENLHFDWLEYVQLLGSDFGAIGSEVENAHIAGA